MYNAGRLKRLSQKKVGLFSRIEGRWHEEVVEVQKERLEEKGDDAVTTESGGISKNGGKML